MQLPATFDDLINDANKYDLYKNLIQQLNKDLLLANVDLGFDLEVIPSSLKFMLHEKIYEMIREKFSDYLNLLYIIDVSEDRVRQLDGDNVLLLVEQVTFLILQREWEKVWYRKIYSQNLEEEL